MSLMFILEDLSWLFLLRIKITSLETYGYVATSLTNNMSDLEKNSCLHVSYNQSKYNSTLLLISRKISFDQVSKLK